MNGVKEHFAERLREAMLTAGLEPRPSVLVNMFNLEHRGESVTFQTASRWLKGMSLPDAAKIRTLARLFGLKPEALLFEGAAALEGAGTPRVTPMSRQDRQLLEAIHGLPPQERRLVRSLVQSLAAKRSAA